MIPHSEVFFVFGLTAFQTVLLVGMVRSWLGWSSVLIWPGAAIVCFVLAYMEYRLVRRLRSLFGDANPGG